MKNILSLTFVLVALIGAAQQDALYTHYAYNTLAVNPAYAGSREALTITALHRSQWVGFEGAPKSQTITLHSPLKNGKMGLGFAATHDQIGPINSTGISGDYAYRLKFNRRTHLAFGLKASATFMQADLAALSATTSGDNTVNSGVRSQFKPNFGFGVYYTSNNWYIGASIPRLLENKLLVNGLTSSEALEKRHYYINAGVALKVNRDIYFKPMVLVKMVPSAPIQADLTGIFVFNKQFELGAMVRSGDAIGLLVGINIQEKLRIGYSFDWSYGIRTSSFNSGSHEIVLRYDLIQKIRKAVISPRHF